MQDGQPYFVTDFQFVKPGKGKRSAHEMRNMLNRRHHRAQHRSGEKLEPADVEDRTLRHLPEVMHRVHELDDRDQVTVQATVGTTLAS